MEVNDVKLKQLREIGRKRRYSCYDGYQNIGEFHNGKYETEFVSPYTKSAGNPNSPVVVLLQDWSSADRLNGNFSQNISDLGYSPELPTNRSLSQLLMTVFKLELKDVFVTNVFPFIKKGGISSRLIKKDVNKAFEEFCYPQIKIIAPKLVICCGKEAFTASATFFKIPVKNLLPVGNKFNVDNTMFYHQRHTGYFSLEMNGGITKAIHDWTEMKSFIK